ncbi:hypothetical protein M407DRAFT_16500 [Tulasnella calospora MUT 4182]|uniref:Hemerythrin-like domain-containing protein n=1 Tax=Tulasnella calospora MUT 4182 TaxID=1051891 RepID=A0A0C3MLD6_9AGAM|nr:hypothetical protein M407DRAFT_16500 [Tulasnella calospora MUT 4182]
MSSPELKLFYCLAIPEGDHNDIFELQAIRMVLLHNVIIRGFNSVLYYSKQIQRGTSELKSFLEYTEQVIKFMHGHHEAEEEIMFPALESKYGPGSMAHNIEGHEHFKAPFAIFENLVEEFKNGTKAWEAEGFQQAIYGFMPVLREHLVDEIETIRPQKLREHFNEAELQDIEEATKKWTLARSSPDKSPQFFFANGDAVHAPWFPMMPPQLLAKIKGDLWAIHADWWSFGSTNKDMEIKPEFSKYEPTLEKDRAVEKSEA